MPCRPSDNQKGPAVGCRGPNSAQELILVGTITRVAERFRSVINNIWYQIDIELVNFLDSENVTFTNEDWNTSLDDPDNWQNIHRFHMIPQHPERYHQATANTHTVPEVLWLLMSLIGSTWNIVWAGELRSKRELDYKAIYLNLATYESIWEDMVVDVHVVI